MAVMMVDNPPGQNAGYYRVLPLDTNPKRDGQWQLLPFHSGVLPVHAALLPKGKVLFYAGSGSSATRFAAANFGRGDVFTSVVWDPTAAPPGNFFHPTTLFAPNHRPFDFFCGGDTFLADGRLLSAGGTGHYNPFTGRNDACVFDPVTEKWAFVKSMAHGRWYPTLITLGDGRALAATGLTEALDNPHNNTIEIYDPIHDAWQVKHFPGGFPGLPLYAHLFLMADGRILFDGGRMDDDLQVNPAILDLTQDPIHITNVDGLEGGGAQPVVSVFAAPTQDQRVMVEAVLRENRTDRRSTALISSTYGGCPHFPAPRARLRQRRPASRPRSS
jgi:hypothetical protein